MPSPDPRVVAIAAMVTAVGLAGAGAGFLNGDSAAYLAQAGDFSQRSVHLGFIALVTLIPDALWLDRLTALVAGVVVLGAGALAQRWHRPGWTGAALGAVAVLPWCSFAEVDLFWLSLVVWAAVVRSARGAGVLLAVAVSVSPVALLALPWVWVQRAWVREPGRREGWAPWVGPLLAVAALTAFSSGDWWVGDRGVLTGPPFDPLRAARAWIEAAPVGSLPLWMLGAVLAGAPGLLACLPLLLAPADVPTVVLPLLSLSLGLGAGLSVLRWRPLWLLLLAGLLLDVTVALDGWAERLFQVRNETARIQAALAELGPDDGLVAPWTWGARASVLATGDPYALPWRVPTEPVREQQAWCDQDFRRIRLLPDDLAPPPGWQVTAGWAPGEAARTHPLPGCAPRP